MNGTFACSSLLPRNVFGLYHVLISFFVLAMYFYLIIFKSKRSEIEYSILASNLYYKVWKKKINHFVEKNKNIKKFYSIKTILTFTVFNDTWLNISKGSVVHHNCIVHIKDLVCTHWLVSPLRDFISCTFPIYNTLIHKTNLYISKYKIQNDKSQWPYWIVALLVCKI